MPRPLSWRKALALPAVLSLALGSALIAAAPASAAPADLVVTAPTFGATLESRVVLITGQGTEDSVITVVDADGALLPETAPVTVDGGAWSVTATFPDEADVAQSATVVQTTAGLEDGTAPLTFTLPAAVPPTEVEFDVTGPDAGSTVGTRAVLFEGTGTDGSLVSIVDAAATVLAEDVPVVDGEWSTTVTYAADAPVAQTATITQSTEGAPNGEETVSFLLPAAVVVPEPGEDAEFAITAPAEGSDVASFVVIVEGTGTNGSVVELSDSVGEPIPTEEPIVITGGTWSATVTYPEDADPVQFIDAVQLEGENVTGETFTYFFLPFEYVDAPVITSPTEGQTIAGDQVTFTGTGEPGADVLLLVIPTDELEEIEDGLGDGSGEGLEGEIMASQQRMAAAAEPADPEDPIVVDENGEWSVTYALEPDEYTTAAVLFDAESGFPISELSELVSFSLVAAAAVDGPGAGDDGEGAGAGDGEGLAVTGSESTGFVGLAAVLLIAGAALVVVNRRASRVETARVE